jgi:hypothetical protein
MAEVAYPTGPTLLGGPHFWGPHTFGGPVLTLFEFFVPRITLTCHR